MVPFCPCMVRGIGNVPMELLWAFDECIPLTGDALVDAVVEHNRTCSERIEARA